MGYGDTPATASLVATGSSLTWFAGYCRIGNMYRAGEAVYLQVHCWRQGDVPVTLAANGNRMRVSWDRAELVDMRRCR